MVYYKFDQCLLKTGQPLLFIFTVDVFKKKTVVCFDLRRPQCRLEVKY